MPFEILHSLPASTPALNIPAMGLELRVSLPPDASDGSLTIWEAVNAPGFGPPLHRHRETEVFRVLEGKYLYEVDGRRFEAVAGDLVTIPGNVAHTFTNITSLPAKQLVIMLPAMDAVAFFTGLGDLMAAGKPDFVALNNYGALWGMDFLGPPIKP
jgi:mannose-6-phosphate isomerase-like protein (cupin superfamily)